MKVQMQFDNRSPWTARAESFHMDDGDGALQFSIGAKSIKRFTREFVQGDTVHVRFPDQDQIEDLRRICRARRRW
jgi:hypothetical protein